MADKTLDQGQQLLATDKVLLKEISPGVYALAQFAVLSVGSVPVSAANPLPVTGGAAVADMAVPAADSAANILMRDVIGNKLDSNIGNSLYSLALTIINTMDFPALDALDNNTFADVIGRKNDTVLGTSIVSRIFQLAGALAVPLADAADNVVVSDAVGNKSDAASIAATASAIALLRSILADVGSSPAHHEHVFPLSDGAGTAGDTLDVITDSADETNGPASTANYWGEPTVFDPAKATPYNLAGLYFEGDTIGKSFQFELLIAIPSLSSAKNAGNAWDEGATVLTVVDGSEFATGDKILIISDYEAEIQDVGGVAGNVVTVVRETSQFGAPNTGLRWNHTTNDPGTEVMYRVLRPSDETDQAIEGYYSAGTVRDFLKNVFHSFRLIEAAGFVAMRILNQTDNANGAHFHCAIVFE